MRAVAEPGDQCGSYNPRNDGCARQGAECGMLDSQTTMEILVADDDASVCDALTYLLTPGGFRVTSFGEGGPLLATARARVPACIILDVRLPDRSGLDILRDLNA